MPDPKTFQVQFQPIGKRIVAAPDVSLFEAARESGLDLASACGGEGNCGQCRVMVLSGETTPPNLDEEFILSELELQQGARLACCTFARTDLTIQVPRESLITGQRLQIGSDLRQIAPDPLVRAYAVTMTPPTLEDIRPDFTRLLDALAAAHGLSGLVADTAVLRTLPAIFRDNHWQVTA
ncbi:MAG: 2Fe-2S iron-sulfur cluster-binding protein, partial [Chloroflexota bacterium]